TQAHKVGELLHVREGLANRCEPSVKAGTFDLRVCRPLEAALVVVAFELELFDEHRFALPCYYGSHRGVAGMTIDIRPELEAKLAAHARAIGMPVQRFVEDVLERVACSATADAPHS